MAVVVVGGHARGVGKTSVVCGLIAATPEYRWTAIKITQHGHHTSSVDARTCDFATRDHSFTISEERDPGLDCDSSRYLRAGAAASYWVRTLPGCLAQAMPKVRVIIESAGNVMIESNSVMTFLHPALYLLVLDPTVQEFKASSLEFLDRVSAFVRYEGRQRWNDLSPEFLRGKPVFEIRRGAQVTREVADFVKSMLETL